MVSWPPLGTRVTVRYRRPPGSLPPLTDAVGHLLAVEPLVAVRTKTGTLVRFAPADAVAVRALTDAPVRTAQIRALEHAAAFAWPGVAQHWLDGWLLRAGHGATLRANSAVPLDVSASLAATPAIIDWYSRRGLTPWLAAADRLLRLPSDTPAECETRTLVGDVAAGGDGRGVALSPRPDDAWLRVYRRQVPVDVLTAVVGGELVFASRAGVAVGRAAVTRAPDGTRWVGLSALRVAEHQRGRGHARAVCAVLLSWGHEHGATRGYMQVRDDDTAAIGLVESMGFRPQHRGRYLDARTALRR